MPRNRLAVVRSAAGGWTRKHWLAGGGSLLGWAAAILLAGTIISWGVIAVGLPQNPSSELAPLATQVALPQPLDPSDALAANDRLALQRDLIEYAADSRVRTWTLLAQVIGALVLGAGGYFTWRNLHLAREGQITNRFTQAIGQLGAELNDGKPNLEVRLGGIYALERIAVDSPTDRQAIFDVLSAYVRHNTWWTPSMQTLDPHADEVHYVARSLRDTYGPYSPSPDRRSYRLDPTVQAALTVLARRQVTADTPEQFRLDLSHTNLEAAELSGANLDYANLRGARLVEAVLRGASLRQADLRNADLRGADLLATRLQAAILSGAHLEDAALGTGPMTAEFNTSADLTGAQMYDTRLLRAKVYEVDLTKVIGLQPEQVISADGWEYARLGKDLEIAARQVSVSDQQAGKSSAQCPNRQI